MHEGAMAVGYLTILYFSLIIALYLVYLPLFALIQKHESPVLTIPLTVLIRIIKIATLPLAALSKFVPRFD